MLWLFLLPNKALISYIELVFWIGPLQSKCYCNYSSYQITALICLKCEQIKQTITRPLGNFWICDWIWDNQSYHPCQQISFFTMNRMEWYMNKLLDCTFKTSYTWIVGFCWLLFLNTVVILTSGIGSIWKLGQF